MRRVISDDLDICNWCLVLSRLQNTDAIYLTSIACFEENLSYVSLAKESCNANRYLVVLIQTKTTKTTRKRRTGQSHASIYTKVQILQEECAVQRSAV